MIWLTRIDGTQVMLNDDQILYLEATHDTIIRLRGGDHLRVLESPDEVARRVSSWRRRVMGLALLSADELDESGRDARLKE